MTYRWCGDGVSKSLVQSKDRPDCSAHSPMEQSCLRPSRAIRKVAVSLQPGPKLSPQNEVQHVSSLAEVHAQGQALANL